MHRNKDPTEKNEHTQWSSWPDFVRAQFDAAEQMRNNIEQWGVQRKAAAQRGDFAECQRLERLIDVSVADMRDKSEQIRQLVKRGDGP